MLCSDMHFGTPESSINVAQFRDPLIDYMVSVRLGIRLYLPAT
jgi:hypothetical protein